MKNIVICTDLNPQSLATLKTLKHHQILENHKIHFLHIFEIHMYNADLVPIIFPTEAQYPDIEISTLTILDKLSRDIGISSEHTELKCFFSHSREEKIITYLKETKAELVILATRGRHGIEGFFSSSLADFLCKYSPCNIFVLRPK